MEQKRKYISWTAMAMLTATAVASVRGLPAMAPYGWASIFLYVCPDRLPAFRQTIADQTTPAQTIP
jgi:hypothetical protein